MLKFAALKVVNHLLAGESWARDRLKPYTGQTVCVHIGALKLPLEISSEGYFQTGNADSPAAVSITLPADAPLRALTDRPALMASAQISGSAEFAECLGFIRRNLHWDVEADVSTLVGDIAARRLVAGGKQLLEWHQQQARNLALNLAEYLTEENPTIASRADVTKFCTEVSRLQTELDPLEARVTMLEKARQAQR